MGVRATGSFSEGEGHREVSEPGNIPCCIELFIIDYIHKL